MELLFFHLQKKWINLLLDLIIIISIFDMNLKMQGLTDFFMSLEHKRFTNVISES